MLSYTHTYVKQRCTGKQKWWLELFITFGQLSSRCVLLRKVALTCMYIHREVS